MSGEGSELKRGPWELAEERVDSEERSRGTMCHSVKSPQGGTNCSARSPLGLHLEKLRDRAQGNSAGNKGSRGASSSFCLSRGVGTEASSTQTPDV